MFHFDKCNQQVLFGDIRAESHILCDGRVIEIKPDEMLDYRQLPYSDFAFKLVVFDPPHLHTAGPKSWMAKKYGKLHADNWRKHLAQGFVECWRVLDKGGTLIFKWNETQIKLRDVLACFSEKPVFGHTTTHNLKTHWMTFYKPLG